MYTDRTYIADMAKIRGTITFHEAAGERDPDSDNKSAWKLRVSRMPCSCLSCRGKIADPCKYMDVRQEQVHWVSERAATRMISRASTEFDSNFKERLSDIFEGSNTVTKTMLQDRLRLLGKSVSGNKSVLAERLIATLASSSGETPNDLPLAAD